MITEEQYKKLMRRKRIAIIADIALIIIIGLIGFYVIKNVELLKALNGDICKMCMEKTGAICSAPINFP